MSSTGGRATAAGFDVVRQAAEVRRRIGLVGQQAAVDEVLSGQLYHLGKARARTRADELLDRFGLAGTGTAACRDLFGNPACGEPSWATDHAMLIAVPWPLALIAIFVPLSVRRCQRLSR